MLEPQPGELIAGRYRLDQRIARGGMGAVWAGHDTKLQRRVAVKLVAPDFDAADDARERFEREAMAVAKLQSPHVVQIFDYGVDRHVPYIVMELLEGDDLHSRLHRLKRVPLELAALILVQTAKALSIAHAAGIIHRDLKPGNIFLVRAGDEEIVKVLDFGVATQVADLLEGSEEKVMGTPQFMSPEQARGLPDLDHRADLWSLGVIVYKALTGRLPFDAGDPTDVIVEVCTADPEPVSKLAPDLPHELDDFFARALARDPEDRFASAREMALAFSRISPVNFTTLSMPDPKAIEEAIAQARGVATEDDDEAETQAVDPLTVFKVDDLEELKTVISPSYAGKLPQPIPPSRKRSSSRPPFPEAPSARGAGRVPPPPPSSAPLQPEQAGAAEDDPEPEAAEPASSEPEPAGLDLVGAPSSEPQAAPPESLPPESAEAATATGDEAQGEPASGPPSEGTFRALERHRSSRPPPPMRQTPQALLAAVAAIAVGVATAVVGNRIMAEAETAQAGLATGVIPVAPPAADTRPEPEPEPKEPEAEPEEATTEGDEAQDETEAPAAEPGAPKATPRSASKRRAPSPAPKPEEPEDVFTERL